MTGKLIVFEGGEGCGKSTQARLLAQAIGALLTREPGGTDTAEQVRTLLLHREEMDPRAEVLLVMAARADHVAAVIAPALSEGRHVVCDRFSGSTVAYQGWGRGLDPLQLASLSLWSSQGLTPDLNILLQVRPEVGAQRLGARGRKIDRMEDSGRDFFTRVDRGFRAQAEEDPRHWLTLDGNPPSDAVHATVLGAVGERLGIVAGSPC